MRHLSAAEILSEDIQLQNVCVFPIREPLDHEASFAGRKRHCSVFFLYLEGQREYTCQNGDHFTLNPGEILYVPQFSTYRFRITNAGNNNCDFAIAVNFEMVDHNGEAVCFGTQPTIVAKDTLSHYLVRFQDALSLDSGTKAKQLLLKSKVYSLCYEIFSELHLNDASREPWRVILQAIDAIESAPAEDIPIPELARWCGVSETQFRKLFNQYTGGLSPVIYRNRLRIEQVKRMLRTEQVTVEYAARAAGFRDMSHFYRLYKRYNQE